MSAKSTDAETETGKTGSTEDNEKTGHGGAGARAAPSKVQLSYLKRGLEQAGGKLPLFDRDGRAISPQTVKACISHGWAEPWFSNPLKKDWLVCRLTEEGRKLLGEQD